MGHAVQLSERLGAPRRRSRMRAAILTLLAAGALFVTGCAPSRPSGTVGSGSVPPSANGSATRATAAPTAVTASGSSNEQRSDAEALRLLALAKVPPGSTSVATPPDGLAGPPLGTAATTSLIDHAAYWRVPLSFSAARTWLAAHPPTGRFTVGSESGSNAGGVDSAGFAYSELDPVSWTQAELQIGVASGRSRHQLRASGWNRAVARPSAAARLRGGSADAADGRGRLSSRRHR